jgi:hypothetical protein
MANEALRVAVEVRELAKLGDQLGASETAPNEHGCLLFEDCLMRLDNSPQPWRGVKKV